MFSYIQVAEGGDSYMWWWESQWGGLVQVEEGGRGLIQVEEGGSGLVQV